MFLVFTEIPTYFTSLFEHPALIIISVEIMMDAFWWDHGGLDNKGIHCGFGRNWLCMGHGF